MKRRSVHSYRTRRNLSRRNWGSNQKSQILNFDKLDALADVVNMFDGQSLPERSDLNMLSLVLRDEFENGKKKVVTNPNLTRPEIKSSKPSQDNIIDSNTKDNAIDLENNNFDHINRNLNVFKNRPDAGENENKENNNSEKAKKFFRSLSTLFDAADPRVLIFLDAIKRFHDKHIEYALLLKIIQKIFGNYPNLVLNFAELYKSNNVDIDWNEIIGFSYSKPPNTNEQTGSSNENNTREPADLTTEFLHRVKRSISQIAYESFLENVLVLRSLYKNNAREIPQRLELIMSLIPKNRPDLTKDFLKLFPIEEAIRVAKIFELKNSLKISTNPNPNTLILDEFYTSNPLKTDNLRYQLDRDSIMKALDSSFMENTDSSSSSKAWFPPSTLYNEGGAPKFKYTTLPVYHNMSSTKSNPNYSSSNFQPAPMNSNKYNPPMAAAAAAAAAAATTTTTAASSSSSSSSAPPESVIFLPSIAPVNSFINSHQMSSNVNSQLLPPFYRQSKIPYDNYHEKKKTQSYNARDAHLKLNTIDSPNFNQINAFPRDPYFLPHPPRPPYQPPGLQEINNSNNKTFLPSQFANRNLSELSWLPTPTISFTNPLYGSSIGNNSNKNSGNSTKIRTNANDIRYPNQVPTRNDYAGQDKNKTVKEKSREVFELQSDSSTTTSEIVQLEKNHFTAGPSEDKMVLVVEDQIGDTQSSTLEQEEQVKDLGDAVADAIADADAELIASIETSIQQR